MKKRLTGKSTRYSIRQLQKGARAPDVAADLGHHATVRRGAVYQVSKDRPHPRRAGRPKKKAMQKTAMAMLDQYAMMPAGATRLTRRTKEDDPKMSCYAVYSIP